MCMYVCTHIYIYIYIYIYEQEAGRWLLSSGSYFELVGKAPKVSHVSRTKDSFLGRSAPRLRAIVRSLSEGDAFGESKSQQKVKGYIAGARGVDIAQLSSL